MKLRYYKVLLMDWEAFERWHYITHDRRGSGYASGPN
jgi:hypothetical protein